MGTGITPEQTSEVMADNRAVLATLLKEEAGDGGLNQSVLIPLGVLLDEHPHGVMQILRHLVFHTHVDRHRIRGLAQLRFSLSTQPSRHGTRDAVKKTERLRFSPLLIQQNLSTTGLSRIKRVLRYSA